MIFSYLQLLVNRHCEEHSRRDFVSPQHRLCDEAIQKNYDGLLCQAEAFLAMTWTIITKVRLKGAGISCLAMTPNRG